MKVVLISTPMDLASGPRLSAVHFPLNLGILLAYIRQHGFEVELWDYNVEPFTEEGFTKRIKESNPGMVGIGAMTPAIKNAHRLATIAKMASPHITTVIGGSHVSALTRETLEEFQNFDVAVHGEAEDTFVDLCTRIQNSQPLAGCLGTAYRSNGSIVMEAPRPLIQDLDKLPFAARDLVNFENYRKAHVERGISRKFMNVMEIMISRGCPAQCIFCVSGAGKGPEVRYRSLGNVMEEIKLCVENYGTNYINISDDTFTLNKKFVEGFCDEMGKLGLQWGCFTRVDCVTKELLQKMVSSGCIRVSFGVETGSQRVMQLNGKHVNLEKIRRVFKWAHEVKLRIIDASLIIGSHPDEDYEDVQQTVEIIKEIKPTFYSVTVIVPLPGTMLYKKMRDEGLILASDWDQFSYYGRLPSWRTYHFTSEDLVKLQKEVIRKTYFRPGYIFHLFTRVRSYNEFRYYADIGLELFKTSVLKRNKLAA
ncbi:MAG: cobalamin B12-binding domain-containing protein [Candidatus Aenigmarchaeota archaeon]|nr:cobalamin B12-binding domain-containing protein [Candidatus Aenigmarchaeota archaeon]